MCNSAVAPHVLLIESIPVYALLSSAELDAAGFEVTLAGSLVEGERWAELLLEPSAHGSPTLILLDAELGSTHANPQAGLALVRSLRQRMAKGTLREATIVGLVRHTSAAFEAAAQAAGCYLLHRPLRPNGAVLLQQLIGAVPLAELSAFIQPWSSPHHAA